MKRSITILILNVSIIFASGLQIKNVTYDTLNQRIFFTVKWDYSWYIDDVPPYNHDAVWIFMKYKYNGMWYHLHVDTNQLAHWISEPYLGVFPRRDSVGVIIRRIQKGKGNIYADVSLSVDPHYPPDAIRVFGIEMVWIPEGPFYVGDNASINTLRRKDTLLPYYITGENITIDSLTCQCQFQMPALISPSFPKGYRGFYIMKYEITQKAYVDFLNTLTYTQQESRTVAPPNMPPRTPAMGNNAFTYMNYIIIVESGSPPSSPATYGVDGNNNGIPDEWDDGSTKAMNFLNWYDLTAYLDWAGLSPMTELEFEKACRGFNYPVPGEFAWGTPFIVDANTIINPNTPLEKAIDTIPLGYGIASHGYSGPQGPLRNGFANRVSSTPALTGASYFGVFEMSGNVWELVVSISDTGITFTGGNGDGYIDAMGNANQNGWTSVHGAGYKGGAWNSGIYQVGSYRDLAVSDRYYITLTPSLRRNTSGGRGVMRP